MHRPTYTPDARTHTFLSVDQYYEYTEAPVEGRPGCIQFTNAIGLHVIVCEEKVGS